MHPEDANRIGNWQRRLPPLQDPHEKTGEKVVSTPTPVQIKILQFFPFWKFFIALKATTIRSIVLAYPSMSP